jgi:hypothetical protein
VAGSCENDNECLIFIILGETSWFSERLSASQGQIWWMELITTKRATFLLPSTDKWCALLFQTQPAVLWMLVTLSIFHGCRIYFFRFNSIYNFMNVVSIL